MTTPDYIARNQSAWGTLAGDERLPRPQRGMHRFEWPSDPDVELHLSHGEWIRLLRANGFEVLALVEIYPTVGDRSSAGFVDRAWAERWPSGEVWRARKAG